MKALAWILSATFCLTALWAPVSAMPFAPAPTDNPIAIAETGLPFGSPWSVELNGATVETNQSTYPAAFDYPAGNYLVNATAQGYVSVPSPSNVTTEEWAEISGPTTLSFHFVTAASVDLLHFNATGVPSCDVWEVTVASVPFTQGTCSGSLLQLDVDKGNWSYAVGLVQSCYGTMAYCPATPFNYTGVNGTAPVGGNVTNVTMPNGTTSNVTVPFASIGLEQEGLPAGTPFGATVGSLILTPSGAAGAEIPVLPRGQYSYKGTAEPGYLTPEGTLHVSGDRTVLLLVYHKVPTKPIPPCGGACPRT